MHINACLESLESRFTQLRQVDQRRAVIAEKILSDLRCELESKIDQLSQISAERDARAAEKDEAHKSVEKLKQQLSAKTAELEAERKEKAAGSERVEALKRELAGVKEELAGMKSEHDARTAEKDEAQKSVEKLKQQLAIKQKALQASNELCSERSDQLSRIEEEMHTLHLRYLRSRRS